MAVGTQQTGYAGPKLGPFKCGNCAHFNRGFCNQAQVVTDPEVPKAAPEGSKAVLAQVKAGGCCNLFDPKNPPKGAQNGGNQEG